MNSHVKEELSANEDVIFMRQNTRVKAQGTSASNIARCRVSAAGINGWLFVVNLALLNWALSLVNYGL